MTAERSLRAIVAAVVLVLSAIAALSFAGTGAAATPCGEKVLADWYDNGRIDRLYPVNCYEEAIDAIPDDIGPYVDAADVITRALQGALRHEVVNGGGCDPSADGSADDCANLPGGATNGGSGGGSGTGDGGSGVDQQAAPDVNTSGPSSVPVPLLVLGGMSLALLAAGGLGYVSRRRHAAQADDVPDDDSLV